MRRSRAGGKCPKSCLAPYEDHGVSFMSGLRTIMANSLPPRSGCGRRLFYGTTEPWKTRKWQRRQPPRLRAVAVNILSEPHQSPLETCRGDFRDQVDLRRRRIQTRLARPAIPTNTKEEGSGMTATEMLSSVMVPPEERMKAVSKAL